MIVLLTLVCYLWHPVNLFLYLRATERKSPVYQTALRTPFKTPSRELSKLDGEVFNSSVVRFCLIDSTPVRNRWDVWYKKCQFAWNHVFCVLFVFFFEWFLKIFSLLNVDLFTSNSLNFQSWNYKIFSKNLTLSRKSPIWWNNCFSEFLSLKLTLCILLMTPPLLNDPPPS